MLLLHISDIHFRHGEIGTAMDPNHHLRNELLRDAQAMCKKIGSAPDAVLLSGDIAFAGLAQEYSFALQWLTDLCEACDTDLTKVIVCPGNHDVVRKTAGRKVVQSIHNEIKSTESIYLDGKLRGLLSDPETSRFLYESIDPYNLFAGQFFCDILPPERTIASKELTLNDGSVLRVSALNTSFVSSEHDKELDLFVDPAAFQITRERGVEHLVMFHHPYNWLRQGVNLKDHLRDVARIHLFGHEHVNRVEPGRDWVSVAASAAHPDRTEPGWEPGYNLIEVNVRGTESARYMDVNVHVRVWQANPGQFRAKMDRDADCFGQSIKLDSWKAPVSPHIAAPTSDSPATPEEETTANVSNPAESDPMSTLREISVRFFKLTLSQKAAVAGKLGLFEDEDMNQPDFERFRRVFIRAKDRGQLEALDEEIRAIEQRRK